MGLHAGRRSLPYSGPTAFMNKDHFFFVRR